MLKIFTAVFVLALLIPQVSFAEDGDKIRGAALFEKHCGACHSLTANRVGPILSGAYGRKVGTVPGFTYSPALKSFGGTWDVASLEKWLTNPRDFIPGQRMNFSVSDPQKRADIIAYLKSEAAPK